MCQKTSNRSQVFLVLKFGLCFLKYSSLVSFTKGESQLNASRWLAVSTLYRGITSHCLELGGPVMFAWGVALLGGEMSIRSGEGCHFLGLGIGSSAGRKGATGVGARSEEEAPCNGLHGRDFSTCPINTWYKATSILWSSAGLAHKAVWQAERKSN